MGCASRARATSGVAEEDESGPVVLNEEPVNRGQRGADSFLPRRTRGRLFRCLSFSRLPSFCLPYCFAHVCTHVTSSGPGSGRKRKLGGLLDGSDSEDLEELEGEDEDEDQVADEGEDEEDDDDDDDEDEMTEAEKQSLALDRFK
jgi:hypothetical protein